MRGLPIGEGEVWRNPTTRALAAWLLALAFVPVVGLFGLALGLYGVGAFALAVAAPALGAIAGIALVARQRRTLLARMAAGLLAGLVGVLVYDALYLSTAAAGYAASALPLWSGPGLSPGGGWLEAVFHHWVTFGALWGMAYGLAVGKARWIYGLWYGLALWVAMATFALFVPHGGPFVPGATPSAMLTLLAGFALFGAVTGLINQRLQPEESPRGKIIFLRDYQRVRSRK